MLAYISFGILAVVLLHMILMRHFLRSAYLEPNFNLSGLEVQPQWSVLIIFAATFILIMIPVVTWMIKTAMNAKKPEY